MRNDNFFKAIGLVGIVCLWVTALTSAVLPKIIWYFASKATSTDIELSLILPYSISIICIIIGIISVILERDDNKNQ
ncbi:hypothetical protein FACS1894120_4510 [Clostridia bacterium]|nr:hypothetical protein FACS1894120_4510 [Clostridia bacterium]